MQRKKNVNNNTENNFVAKGSLVGGKTLFPQKQRFVVFREEPGRGRSRAASRFRIYRSVLFCISSEYFLTSWEIGVFAGLAFMTRQIVNSPGFYANRTERQRGIDEPEKEKSMRGSNWYNHKVRRYFGERNKRKAPGEVFPTLNAKFAPVSQPYDEILGRKRNG